MVQVLNVMKIRLQLINLLAAFLFIGCSDPINRIDNRIPEAGKIAYIMKFKNTPNMNDENIYLGLEDLLPGEMIWYPDSSVFTEVGLTDFNYVLRIEKINNYKASLLTVKNKTLDLLKKTSINCDMKILNSNGDFLEMKISNHSENHINN